MRLVNRIRTPGIDNAGFTKSPGAILNSAALAELARGGEPDEVKDPVDLLAGERIVQDVQSPPFKRYRIVKRRKGVQGCTE